MAKYQKYAEYKDSGVEWLGEIPSHWKVTRLKFLAKIKNGQDYKHVEAENGYPVMGSGGQFTFSKEYMFDKPSVLLGRKGTIDKPLFIDEPFWTVDTMYYTDVQKEIDVKYFYYLAKTILFDRYSTNTALPSMTQENLNNFEFAIPHDIGERQSIRSFLDHETAKIDSLIEKQQKLIELLKEKRQAVISHAVTKGLNPDVPMKDSGVEWLGQVPEHWISSRLKYYTNQIVDGAHFTPTYSETGIPFLRVTDIHNDEIDMENIKYIPEHEHLDLIQRCKPEKGDLLLSKNGTIGIPKLINWEWEFSIFVSLCLIKFKKNLRAEFAEYFFKSYEIREQIFGLIKKSTVINLHLDKIQNFWFSIPPMEEQTVIVNYLDKKVVELSNLIAKAESAIQLMQERRTALISSAVTGEIDVRHWQNPNHNNNEAQTELSL